MSGFARHGISIGRRSTAASALASASASAARQGSRLLNPDLPHFAPLPLSGAYTLLTPLTDLPLALPRSIPHPARRLPCSCSLAKGYRPSRKCICKIKRNDAYHLPDEFRKRFKILNIFLRKHG